VYVLKKIKRKVKPSTSTCCCRHLHLSYSNWITEHRIFPIRCSEKLLTCCSKWNDQFYL